MDEAVLSSPKKRLNFTVDDKERIWNIFMEHDAANQHKSNAENAEYTAKKAGVSVQSVHRILREYKITKTFESPKVYQRQRAILDNVDDATKSALKLLINSFFERNVKPTLDKILVAMKAEHLPLYKRSTLRRLIREIGFPSNVIEDSEPCNSQSIKESLFKIKDESDILEVDPLIDSKPTHSVPINPNSSKLINGIILTKVPNPFTKQKRILKTNLAKILNNEPAKKEKNQMTKPFIKIVDINKLKTATNITNSKLIATNTKTNNIVTILNNDVTKSSISNQKQSNSLILNQSNSSILNTNQSNAPKLNKIKSKLPNILAKNNRKPSLRIAARKSLEKTTKEILQNTIESKILSKSLEKTTKEILQNTIESNILIIDKKEDAIYENDSCDLLSEEDDILVLNTERLNKKFETYSKKNTPNKLGQMVTSTKSDIGGVDQTELPDSAINQNHYKTPKVCIICGRKKTSLVICSPFVINKIEYVAGIGFGNTYAKGDPRFVLRACELCIKQVYFFHKVKQSIIKTHSILNGPHGHAYNIDWASRNSVEVKHKDVPQLSDVIDDSEPCNSQSIKESLFKIKDESDILEVDPLIDSKPTHRDTVNEDRDVIKTNEDEKLINIQPPFPEKEHYDSDDMKQYPTLLKFGCFLCNKKFLSEDGLSEHHHEVHAHFKCNMCDFVGTTFNEFTKHKNDEHNELIIKENRGYICEYCGLVMSRVCGKRHVTTHFPNSEIVCELCGKCFSHIHYLFRHKFRVHSGSHNCEICEKKFNNVAALRRHKVIHTGEKPYECKICHLRFSRSSNLSGHKRIHTNSYPYKCVKCPQSFRHNVSRKIHESRCDGNYDADAVAKKREKQLLMFAKKRQQGGTDARQPKPKKAKKDIITDSSESERDDNSSEFSESDDEPLLKKSMIVDTVDDETLLNKSMIVYTVDDKTIENNV